VGSDLLLLLILLINFQGKHVIINNDWEVVEIDINPYKFKLETLSIWSFKERGNWATHKGDYRGNCPPQVPRNLLLKYTKEKDIVLDPFCGSGTTLIECKLLNRIGVGIDINQEALNIAKKRLNFIFKDNYNPKLIKANSTNLRGIVPDGAVDFIFAHPPYSNIIEYSQDIKEDISRLELIEFLNQIEVFSKECFRILKKEKFCSILIGDIRKKGNFTPLGFQLMNIFINTGFKLKEIIIKEQHNCKGTKKWEGKVNKFYLLAHEYIFIFTKD